MQGFVDDTGTHGDALDCTLVGVIARAERWETFTQRWVEICAELPPIPDFHMSDGIRVHGGYWGDADEPKLPHEVLLSRRDNRLTKLRALVVDTAEFAVRVSLRREAFNRIARGEVPRSLNDPYCICFLTLLMAAAKQGIELGWSLVQFTFDDQGTLGRDMAKWIPDVISGIPPEAAAVMDPEPRFAHDRDIIPIKAADMAAWYFQRSHEDHRATGVHTYTDELREFSEIPGGSQDIDDDSLRQIVAGIKKCYPNG